MANYEEPMEVDELDNNFDNKENSFQNFATPTKLNNTEKGYEELDVSELNMKLRMSCTPMSSPMHRSLTETRKCIPEAGDSMNNTLTLNITDINGFGHPIENHNIYDDMNFNASNVSTRSLTANDNQDTTVLYNSISTDNLINSNNVNSTHDYLNQDEYFNAVDTAVALNTSTSSTPTKEIPKTSSSPIMRGLKSVLNMFRPSQSPITSQEYDNCSMHHEGNTSKIEEKGSDLTIHSEERSAINITTASTPVHNQNNVASEVTSLKGVSPHTPESIIFNDDLVNDLQWNDDTTIIFNKNKLLGRKLYTPSSSSSFGSCSRDSFPTNEIIIGSTQSENVNEVRPKENLNSSKRNISVQLEPMDISLNESSCLTENLTAKENHPNQTSPLIVPEFSGKILEDASVNDKSENIIPLPPNESHIIGNDDLKNSKILEQDKVDSENDNIVLLGNKNVRVDLLSNNNIEIIDTDNTFCDNTLNKTEGLGIVTENDTKEQFKVANAGNINIELNNIVTESQASNPIFKKNLSVNITDEDKIYVDNQIDQEDSIEKIKSHTEDKIKEVLMEDIIKDKCDHNTKLQDSLHNENTKIEKLSTLVENSIESLEKYNSCYIPVKQPSEATICCDYSQPIDDDIKLPNQQALETEKFLNKKEDNFVTIQTEIDSLCSDVKKYNTCNFTVDKSNIKEHYDSVHSSGTIESHTEIDMFEKDHNKKDIVHAETNLNQTANNPNTTLIQESGNSESDLNIQKNIEEEIITSENNSPYVSLNAMNEQNNEDKLHNIMNHNYECDENPFITKTKIRMSPPPQSELPIELNKNEIHLGEDLNQEPITNTNMSAHMKPQYDTQIEEETLILADSILPKNMLLENLHDLPSNINIESSDSSYKVANEVQDIHLQKKDSSFIYRPEIVSKHEMESELHKDTFNQLPYEKKTVFISAKQESGCQLTENTLENLHILSEKEVDNSGNPSLIAKMIEISTVKETDNGLPLADQTRNDVSQEFDQITSFKEDHNILSEEFKVEILPTRPETLKDLRNSTVVTVPSTILETDNPFATKCKIRMSPPPEHNDASEKVIERVNQEKIKSDKMAKSDFIQNSLIDGNKETEEQLGNSYIDETKEIFTSEQLDTNDLHHVHQHFCNTNVLVPDHLNDMDRNNTNPKISAENSINKNLLEENVDNDISMSSLSSKASCNKDLTVIEVRTEDEDTAEGPHFPDLHNESIENILPRKNELRISTPEIDFNQLIAQEKYKTSSLNNSKEEVSSLEKLKDEFNHNIDDEFKPGELFINAETFDFLMNQNTDNDAIDSGKKSLFLKFDPLCAKELNSQNVATALANIRNDGTPCNEHISKRDNLLTTEKNPRNDIPIDGNICEFYESESSAVNENVEEQNNIAIRNNNYNVEKPVLAVSPALNIGQDNSQRNSYFTPNRPERRSMTYTSPAIAAIDRLISLSGNNTPISYNLNMTTNAIESNEAFNNILQLSELLAQKEENVRQLKIETKELQSRLTDLEIQMKGLQEDNDEKLKRIDDLQSKLTHKTHLNKNMATVVEEYERTIAGLIGESEQDKKRHEEERAILIQERDEQTAHLASMEVSFSDLHTKYERCKQIVLGYKANEDAFRKSINEYESTIKKMEANYELLKQHATVKMNNANNELEKLKKSHESEVLKLSAQVKRKELHASSLEETLAHKIKANEELTAICDELISKVG